MFSIVETRVEKNMGAITPIVYHCKRCHATKETRNRTGRGHQLPRACGQQGCGAPGYDVFPEVCFKPGFDPFVTVTPKGRLPLFNYTIGDWCEECFFEWAREMRQSKNWAMSMWLSRPKKLSDNKTVETNSK